MKTTGLHIATLILLSCSSLWAQDHDTMTVFPISQLEEDPVFKEGSIDEYLEKHFVWSDSIDDYGAPGTIYLNFIVHPDGTLSNIKASGPTEIQKKEAIRVVQSTSGMWVAAKVKGNFVASKYTAEIVFKLDQFPHTEGYYDSLSVQYNRYRYNDSIYVDELAYFKGGNFINFVASNFIFTKEMRHYGRPGTLYLQFTVEMDGSLSNVKILSGKGLSSLQDAEAVRVILLTSGKWEPAKINGKPVRSIHKQAFVFSRKDFYRN